MPVFAVQCPNCGSPVDPNEAVKGRLVCKSCGSFLEIVTGSSGFPMAHLLAIEEDTNYLVKSQTAERLKAQLAELEAQYAEMQQKVKAPSSATTAIIYVYVFFIALIIGFIIDSKRYFLDFAYTIVTPFVALFLTMIIHNTNQKHDEAERVKAMAKYAPQLASLPQQIAEKRAQLAKIEAELDVLARNT